MTPKKPPILRLLHQTFQILSGKKCNIKLMKFKIFNAEYLPS
jgi:hypothetical protein